MRTTVDLNEVMLGALCELQRQLELNDEQMAERLCLSVRRFKRLKKSSKTMPVNSMKMFENMLKSKGWFDAK